MSRTGEFELVEAAERGRTTLAQRLAQGEVPLLDALRIAVGVADALSHVHARGIVHRNVNAHNVVLEDSTGACRLIDFGLATSRDAAASPAHGPSVVEGALTHVSPEQTGRLNRRVDERSDLYALGVTLYEVFGGRLPHAGSDPMALIHAHLAVEPIPLHELDPRLPEVISGIVGKLLRKAPEERYQSAIGVREDLQVCLARLLAGSHLEPFPLGRHEVHGRLDLPTKVYGRSSELQVLLQAYGGLARAGVQAFAVSGDAGIGKTTLLDELSRLVLERGGCLAASTCDPGTKDLPYRTLATAFGSLMKRLLQASDDRLRRHRDRIQSALGRQAQLIIDLIPEVELVIGAQPPVPELGGFEALSRIKLALGDFVGALSAPEHPLVLCLDELQWADSASLQLLGSLVSTFRSGPLLLVTAGREDNTSSAYGSWIRAVEQHVPVRRVQLGALREDDVFALLCDTVHGRGDHERALSKIVGLKTGGNPFFVRQFLSSLHENGLLSFDRASATWRSSLDAVEREPSTDNMGELLANKLARLTGETQHLLGYAATLGREFGLAPLASLCNRAEPELKVALRHACESGVIRIAHGTYAFVHERVRETAHATLSESDRMHVHRLLGRRLATEWELTQADATLFEALKHLNGACKHGDDPQEREWLARLNVRAATRAQRTTAYLVAASHLRHVLELAPDGLKFADIDGTNRFDLLCRLSQNLCLGGSFTQSLEVARDARRCGTRPEDEAQVLVLESTAYFAMSRLRDAVRSGLEAVSALGQDFPRTAEGVRAALHTEIGQILAWTASHEIETILDLPRMSEPRMCAMMQVLMSCIPAAYQLDPELFSLICCRMVTLSLEHGNHATSAKGYGSFAVIVGGVLGNFRDAERFARVGVDLGYRLGVRSVLSSAHFVFAGFSSIWRHPVAHSLEDFRLAIDLGLETGDHPHATYSGTFVSMHQLFAGTPLEQLRADAKAHMALLTHMGDRTNIGFQRGTERLVKFLSGELENPNSLDDATFDDETYFAEITSVGNAALIARHAVTRLMHRYFCGDYAAALRFAADSERLLPATPGLVSVAEHHLFGSLAAAAFHPQAEAAQRLELEATLERNEKVFQHWAANCPENFQARLLLVQAERARLRGDALGATESYDLAIDAAAAAGFPNIVGIASQRAADLWREREKPEFSAPYLRRAHSAYAEWGALGLVRALESNHVGLAEDPSDPESPTPATTSESLDLGSVIKAARAISSEIVLERLLERLMGIIFETAGAQSGALLLPSEQGLLVQAASTGAQSLELMQSVPVDLAKGVCAAVVNYVARRSEAVVLEDASREGPFVHEPYIRAHEVKSVLCTAIRNKGELAGVLYLENNLVAGAFTADRLRALEVLTAQIAVSIENARLFESLQKHATIIASTNEDLRREIDERTAAQAELARYRDHLEDLVEQRTRDLLSAQNRLLEVSRAAGMAEVATGILHNVGNALNSVVISADLISEEMSASPASALDPLATLLADHEHELAEFLTQEERGSKVIGFIRGVAADVRAHDDRLREEASRLRERIEHIAVVVAKQQDYAVVTSVVQECTVLPLVEEAIAVAKAARAPKRPEIHVDVSPALRVLIDRHRVLHILVNLLTNAIDAVDAGSVAKVDVRTGSLGSNRFYIRVTDNGVGIASQHLEKIFVYGFTTKPHGHGFGLHNAANAAKAMGGVLRHASAGLGHGAAFTLELPVTWEDAAGHAILAAPYDDFSPPPRVSNAGG